MIKLTRNGTIRELEWAMSDLILVVDDEPVQRRLLEATLEKLGFKAMCVAGGQAAIDTLSGKKGEKIKAVRISVMYAIFFIYYLLYTDSCTSDQ